MTKASTNIFNMYAWKPASLGVAGVASVCISHHTSVPHFPFRISVHGYPFTLHLSVALFPLASWLQ
jgi:hypothetical protein